MNCALLDFGCHSAQVAFDLWHGLSLPSQALIVIGLLSIAGWALWGAAKALKAFGGWPAVIGAGAVLIGAAGYPAEESGCIQLGACSAALA